MKDKQNTDILVVGAGHAGSAAAAALAEAGFGVTVVERRHPRHTGPHWANAVPEWCFDEAGLNRPEPPERLRPAGVHNAHLRNGFGRPMLTVVGDPGLHVDMRRLTRRLQDKARAAGAVFRRALVQDVIVQGDRVIGVRLRSQDQAGAFTDLRARLTVDASGLAAVVRRRAPTLNTLCPEPAATDICDAAQFDYAIANRAGAEAFLARQDALDHDTISDTGIAGAWSTRMISVDLSAGEVALLGGSIPAMGTAPGLEILANTLRQEPWIGRRLRGGRALIPLGQPFLRLSGPGVALIGNSANQVYSLHGSGVGFSLIAARLLADALRGATDPGDENLLYRYDARFGRRYGGRLAAVDLLRRFAQTLSTAQGAETMGSGMISLRPALAGLLHHEIGGDPAIAPAVIKALPRMPLRLSRLALTGLRMAAIQRLWRHYPEGLDPKALARFGSIAEQLTGLRG